mmetsp:Transcript_67431/g.179327  ORF Transcript_67431/g.179327 Transcript_67431/m.179327 type:complete len:220 (+) Transcript_67431:2292-2951(+)
MLVAIRTVIGCGLVLVLVLVIIIILTRMRHDVRHNILVEIVLRTLLLRILLGWLLWLIGQCVPPRGTRAARGRYARKGSACDREPHPNLVLVLLAMRRFWAGGSCTTVCMAVSAVPAGLVHPLGGYLGVSATGLLAPLRRSWLASVAAPCDREPSEAFGSGSLLRPPPGTAWTRCVFQRRPRPWIRLLPGASLHRVDPWGGLQQNASERPSLRQAATGL